MKITMTATIAALAFGLMPLTATQAAPADDVKAFQDYYGNKFKETKFDDYVNGIYSIDAPSREQWEEIEEFPPYELAVETGEELWNIAFKNGKGFKDCFTGDVAAIRSQYPRYDAKADTIVTLEGDINKCRTDNGEKAFGWKKGNIAAVSAYVAYQGRGKEIAVKMPTSDKELAWYNKGKTFFYAKRGQLNMACADCHVYNSGQFIRGDKLSPGLGHPSHFPVYRSKWGSMGTLHRRYAGCNKNIRAKPFKAQSDEYKALEYFQAIMSNGLKWNGPGARK
jgi:sulfur-oxidizing protein SoxA